jgi:hypothetical protein
MKTKIILVLIFMVCTFTEMMAQYSIPSYNIDITQKATFQELSQEGLVNPLDQGKKDVNIEGHTPLLPAGSPCAQVWVYSLDKRNVLGPYELVTDQVLQVPVDDRAWGVYIEVSAELFTDVWIDEGL